VARPTLDGFLVLVPVKATGRGKSRLGGDEALRRRLALAMAMDTTAAAAAADPVRAVLALVEDDEDGVAIARASGALVHRVSARGLNQAIREGASLPLAGSGAIASLPADLPSLLPGELAAALEAAIRYPFAVVADRDGTGTTLLTASRPELLRPRYGVGSLAAHRAAGATLLPIPASSGLRRDVDLSEDLLDASGPHTAALLAEPRAGGVGSRAAR
jgi:2-phospho-L-lactate guanylyltransferase